MVLSLRYVFIDRHPPGLGCPHWDTLFTEEKIRLRATYYPGLASSQENSQDLINYRQSLILYVWLNYTLMVNRFDWITAFRQCPSRHSIIHVRKLHPRVFVLRLEKLGSCSLSLFPICGQHLADGPARPGQTKKKKIQNGIQCLLTINGIISDFKAIWRRVQAHVIAND